MIDPRGMTLRDYADSLVLSVDAAWSFGKLEDEADWQSWAVGFVRANNFAQQLPPNPYMFSNWRDWAERAYTMLEAG